MKKQTFIAIASRSPKYIIAVLIGLTVIFAFTPLLPNMPSAGLDPSWRYAMNEATAQGLAFGKEIIFTFGPYAAISTKIYHPNTDTFILFGSLVLGLCGAALLLLLTRRTPLIWAVAYCIIIATLMYVRDPLYYSYPLMLSLAIYRITLPPDSEYAIKLTKKAEALFAILFIPLGLLSLIKGSYLILSVAISGLSFILFWHTGRKSLAYYSLAVPFASAIFFWLISGQSLFDVPYYLLNLKEIISGYTEAMATTGKHKEILYYMVASGSILFLISTQKGIPKQPKAFLFFSMTIVLFLAFKGSFVRHDNHAIIASTVAIIAASLLPLAIRHRQISIVFILCFISWFYTDNRRISTSTTKVYTSAINFYKNSWQGIHDRLFEKNALLTRFNKKNLNIKKDYLIPPLDGTTDIYSYNQSHLIASDNNWSPRPTFQSYSVYTPKLAKINEEHLYGDRAPDNIIFKVEPIDGRLPALEDGTSWPAIIHNYTPTSIDNGFLFLKNIDAANTRPKLTEISDTEYLLGTDVEIPVTDTAIFAEINIQQTLIGRLLSFIFKPQPLSITLELASGQKATYKMISTMAQSGFIISPLVKNTNDFIFLLDKNQRPWRKYIRSINISPKNGDSIFWKNKYSIKLSKLDLPKNDIVSNFVKFDQVINQAPNYSIPAYHVKCEGNIDSFNGSRINTDGMYSSGILAVRGWIAVSVDKELAPESIYAVLTDKQGNKKFIEASILSSHDVSKHFKKPNLGDVRFKFIADISHLEGEYQFTMARAYSGVLELCEQPWFNFKVNLTKTNSN